MKKEVVLIVEDEADIRELIGMYILAHDFEVRFAEDGERGIVAARRERPDLIILDVNLPGMDGVEACKRLRKETMSPILFLTCRDEPEDMVEGLAAGGDDYITKPFDPDVLIARVRAQLRRFRQYDRQPEAMVAPSAASGSEFELTQQEINILRLIETGYTNREISDRLNLTVGTIKWYNNQIFGKLEVANRTQAIARARQLGMLPAR